ncbi:MAG: hypothetical protein JNL39_16915 [Opitutaceae bacterium]|nr:hypothetical protein [Opitutaceae bacterium]
MAALLRRTLVLLAAAILLWALVAQLNHALASWRIHVFTGGLFVVFAALTQPHRAGLAAVLLAGLVCDAHAPVPFGLHGLLFAAAHELLFRVRNRVPRNDAVVATAVALVVNLALFLAISFTQIHHAPVPSAAWARLLMDLLASQIVLALVCPWWSALQARALALARVPRFDIA